MLVHLYAGYVLVKQLGIECLGCIEMEWQNLVYSGLRLAAKSRFLGFRIEKGRRGFWCVDHVKFKWPCLVNTLVLGFVFVAECGYIHIV